MGRRGRVPAETRALAQRREEHHTGESKRDPSGWRTLSRDAANVLSGVPPIRFLDLERKEIWVKEEEYRLRQGHLPEEERNIIRAKARETLFQRWQEEWDSSKDGRWMHKLVPKIKEWVLREHGSMEYRLTQELGGHGFFGGYLAK